MIPFIRCYFSLLNFRAQKERERSVLEENIPKRNRAQTGIRSILFFAIYQEKKIFIFIVGISSEFVL
jgi:hypothetical protein